MMTLHTNQILTKLLSKDLLEGVLDERVALLDSIWDLESDLGLGKEANSMFTGYVSGYIKDFIKAKNTLSLLPNKVLDVAHAQKLPKEELRGYLASSLAGQEVILFFTFFASTKHRVQELASILLAILRLVEQRVGDAVLLLDELEEETSNQLSSEEGRNSSPSGTNTRNIKKNVGGKAKPADRKPIAAVVVQTPSGDGMVRLSGKHASLKNLLTLVAGCEALKMWIFVIKSFESLLDPIGNQNFNSSQAGLLGSFSVRKALDQLISGGVKAQKPGLFKYSFSRVVGVLPTSFKTYDRAIFELVDAASAGSASTAGKPGVVVPTHIAEDLRKVAGHIADSSLAEVLQTDCGDWKKPDKISNFGKKQTQKGRRPAKRAKKGRRQSHGWSDDSDSDEAANHYSDESEDSDDFLPVKKQKR